MIPDLLSSDLCSLKSNVERWAISTALQFICYFKDLRY